MCWRRIRQSASVPIAASGLQIPTWDRRLFDLEKAAESQTYCDEVKGILKERGLQVTELSTHLQGQLVAVHPAFDADEMEEAGIALANGEDRPAAPVGAFDPGQRLSRNAACPCGSGKKYKHCHGRVA